MSPPQGNDADHRARSPQIQLIIEQCIERRAAGKVVTDESLIKAHPELMPDLEDALRDLRLVEQAQALAAGNAVRGLHIRCPHCHNPIEVVDESSLSEVVCPSCGSQFSLTDNTDHTFQVHRQEMINHFRLLNRVGVGAFGSVWSAHDTQLDRVVALKIPRRGQLSFDDTEQFIREARAAAQLKHPNVVSVLEVGRYKDRIYIACDFIQGLDLADWLIDSQPTSREAAELCATLADALQHAHDHGVIHRDLKPSNVMLDQAGQPHLMDFGLAKREAGEVTMTVDGKLLGTPAYMSPEQARGDAHDADARSDIYSVGVILFELLTGERPFRGNTRMLLHQVLVEDAPSPRKLNPGVPRDLETICLKCLEKDPVKRYQTAGELRDDLKRFSRGEPVQARPIRRIARAWRWTKRNRTRAALLAAIGLFALGGPLVALRLAALAADLKAKSQDELRARQIAEQSSDQLRRLLYASDMNAAQQELKKGSISGVIELLERHRPKSDEIDLRGFEWYYHWAACERAIRARSFSENEVVVDIRFSPDGSTLHTATSGGTVTERDSATFEIVRSAQTKTLDATFLSNFLQIAPDGNSLAMGVMKGVRVVDLRMADEALVSQNANSVTAVAISPDGTLCAFGDTKGCLTVWNRVTEQYHTPAFPAHVRFITGIAFSPDGRTLATGGSDPVVKLWDVATGTAQGEPLNVASHCKCPSNVWALKFSPDGQSLAAGTDGDYSAIVWRVTDAQMIRKFDGADAPVTALAFSPDSQLIATAGHVVQLWHIESGRLVDVLRNEHGAEQKSLEFSPDGLTLATSTGSHCSVKLWPLDTAKNPLVLAHGGHSKGDLSADGKVLVTASYDGSIKVWDLTRRATISEFSHGSPVWALQLSRDGTKLASGGTITDEFKVWNTLTGELLHVFPHQETPTAVQFSLDDRFLACLASNGTILIWDLPTGQLHRTIKAHDRSASGLSFSPDGKVLATAGSDFVGGPQIIQKVRFWDVESGQLLNTIEPPNYQHIKCLAFSPDGTQLAVSGSGGEMELWDFPSLKKRFTMTGHLGSVSCLVFSADGGRLLSSDDRNVKFWDLSRGRVQFELEAHDAEICFLALTPDQRTVITGSRDHTIKLWRAADSRDVDRLRVAWNESRSLAVRPDFGGRITTTVGE